MDRQKQWSAPRRRLREMVCSRDGRILVAVGVGSGIEARLLHHALSDLDESGRIPDYVGGFIVFVSGYLCAAAHGVPDLGYILRSEIVRQTDTIEQASWLAALDRGNRPYPLGVDIDTGYGNEPSAVVLTVRQAHKQGAAYVQIEDQYAINKSCGHMEGSRGAGKSVCDLDEMMSCRLLPALSYAREQDDLLIAARTDARGALGLDEALRRAAAFAEAGADMVFVEAPKGSAELKRVAQELSGCGALNTANMVEGSGHTPFYSPRELHEMGFDIALYPVGAFLAAQHSASRYFATLFEARSGPHPDIPDQWFDRVSALVGRDQGTAWNSLFDDTPVSTAGKDEKK